MSVSECECECECGCGCVMMVVVGSGRLILSQDGNRGMFVCVEREDLKRSANLVVLFL